MRAVLSILILLMVAISVVHAETDEEKAQDVLRNASERLGWPDTVTVDESNNGSIGPQYFISETGKGQDDDLTGSIIVLPTDALSGVWLNFLTTETDMEHSSYQGRDGAISTYGENCNPKPLVKMINDMVNGFFESIFGPSNDEKAGCVTDHGDIVWACGKYLMLAADNHDDSGGGENGVAANLYAAAQSAGLCDYGDTLVIMADTADKEGSKPLSGPIQMTQKINQFYGVNSMGAVPPFKFSFMDAGDADGNGPWFDVGNPISAYPYPNSNYKFGSDAIKAAFKGADVPQDLYFERVVVVYPGDGHQNDPNAQFSNACSWRDDSNFVQVDAAQGSRKIYVKNLIMLSENRELGGWVHEFGHTMLSQYQSPVQPYRILDRYNYDASTSPDRQYGYSGFWDLMGSGSHWGADDGGTPTQMASFTKVAAGWLSYQDAALNTQYTLTPLEDMKQGDKVLRLDDPTSTNSNEYAIIEARDHTAAYGAPASGVEIYDVKWDNTYHHHIVNVMTTQSGQTKIASNDGDYETPTLYSAQPSPGSVYDIPPWQLKIVVTSLTRQPYSPTVEVENYTPTNLVGVQLNPGPLPVNGTLSASTTENSNNDDAPEMDLEAYDSAGDHVGLNPSTGQFDNNIPGAIASGPSDGGEEWIFVPAGTQVRYDVNTERTQKFLSDNPELAATAVPQSYDATAVKFDASGNRFEADLGNGTAGAGNTVPLTSPDDASVQYTQKIIPGVGNNSSCPLLPGFISVLALSAFLIRREREGKAG